MELPRATLDREARRQGQRAEQKRQQLDQEMNSVAGARAQRPAYGPSPFTLVLEIGAQNIRERDDWGRSARQRARGLEPPRWHWVYGATCFRLDARVQKGRRAMLLSRGTAMTRGGLRRGEPLGSGSIESTCRQCQCRFKRPGQYWTPEGDEALMCLETF